MPYIPVATTSEIPQGEGRTIEADGCMIALFHTEKGYFAINNTCCHRGAPLGQGHLEGIKVTCPWHAWEFDVTTGICAEVPDAEVPSYPVKVEGDQILVEIPDLPDED